MSGAYEIVLAGDDDATRWDAFVSGCATATFFHLFGWRRIVERVYGYKACYLMALQSGSVVGALPLIDVRSALFGRSLISTAFTVGGGIAGGSDECRRALAAAALREGERRRARYVELRSSVAGLDGWELKNSVYAGFEAPLCADPRTALEAIPRKRRAEVRKGIEALESGALRASYSTDAADFYPLYAEAMRDHGTPIFPRRFAAEVMREFAPQTDVLVVEAGKTPTLALLTFRFRDRVMPYYFGAAAAAREHRAFDLAIWLTMRRGAERGARIFDFGRSKYGTGAFDYKRHWGFEPHPLEYQYALLSARTTPNISPANPKFAAAAAAWRRLPLPIANLAGPMLARHLA